MKSNIIKTGILLLAGIATAAGISWLAGPCGSGCNVILIMVDTLSGEHIGTYGYPRDTMPEVTTFFEKHGIIFDNATANSTWTMPSFIGMYFSDIASNITYKELDDHSRPNLPDEMRSHGVTLRAIRPAHNIFIFDAITRLYQKSELRAADETRDPIALGRAELTGLENAKHPFFLLIHTFEAHEPYKPQPPYNEYFGKISGYDEVTAVDLVKINWQEAPATPELINAYKLRYDQQIAQADHHIAGFLNSIATSTLAHTVVILSADHGESFYEHESLRHGNNGLYQEELHVPMMMRGPGLAPRRIEQPVSLMDIAPTVLSLLHILVPKEFKGDSLVPVMRGGTLGNRTIPLVTGIPAYLDLHAPAPPTLEAAGAAGSDWPIIPPYALGVRIGAEKLFTFIDDPKQTGWRLYDLKNDPRETDNRATGTASFPQQLKDAVEALRAEIKPE